MDKKKTIEVVDLEEAFGEKVRRIANERGLSDSSAQYLTTLLVRKSRTEPIPSTLFDLYRKALESDRHQTAQCYKDLGDQALFVLGVFPESLSRRAVSPSYYKEMGQGAYGSVAGLVRTGNVFQELAEGFVSATWTFRDVFEEFRLEGSQDILALYAEWERTGSLRILRRLQELGFHFTPIKPGAK